MLLPACDMADARDPLSLTCGDLTALPGPRARVVIWLSLCAEDWWCERARRELALEELELVRLDA